MELLKHAVAVEAVCAALGRPYCFIGGVALLCWSEPRVTKDLDLSVFCGFGGERAVVAQLLGNFRSRVANPETFALQNRVRVELILAGVSSTRVKVSSRLD